MKIAIRQLWKNGDFWQIIIDFVSYIVLFSTTLRGANCATVTRKILAKVTDSRGILLLRLRERTSERLPDDWHGTKYRAVKQLSKNTHGRKKTRRPVTESRNNLEPIEDKP